MPVHYYEIVHAEKFILGCSQGLDTCIICFMDIRPIPLKPPNIGGWDGFDGKEAWEYGGGNEFHGKEAWEVGDEMWGVKDGCRWRSGRRLPPEESEIESEDTFVILWNSIRILDFL